MRVFIFSFGFGKRLLGLQVGRHRLPPLADPARRLREAGGRARRPPERGHQPAWGTARDFTARPRWQRFVVYLAGPFMNGVLTVGVLTALYMIGFQVDASLYDRPIVGAVEPRSPAARGGPRARRRDRRASTASRSRAGRTRSTPSCCGPTRRSSCACAARARSAMLTVRSRLHLGREGGHDRRLPAGARRAGGRGRRRRQPRACARTTRSCTIDGKPIRSFTRDPGAGRRLGGQAARAAALARRPHLRAAVTPRDDGQGPRIGIAPKTVVKQFGFVSRRRGGRALDLEHDQADLRGARAPAHRADLAEDDDGAARHREGLGRRRARRARRRCSTWWR